MVRVESTVAIVDAQTTTTTKMVKNIVRVALTIEKKYVKWSGKNPNCKTNFRGAGALVYLCLSFPATKRRNSCAAGVRPDAPLFHHEV